jgi:thiol-disulfide isomerase/thioredoxin
MKCFLISSILLNFHHLAYAFSIPHVPATSSLNRLTTKTVLFQTANGKDCQNADETGTDAINMRGIPQIKSIQSREDLFDFLKEDERLCVIKFYAKWCKSCAKFGLKFKHLAHEHGDLYDNHGALVQDGDIRFAEIEYSQNVKLCKTFGIKKLPYVQIYKAKHGRVDEFVCGPRDFNVKVVSKVEQFLAMSDEEIIFLKNMEDGEALVNEIVASNSTSTVSNSNVV